VRSKRSLGFFSLWTPPLILEAASSVPQIPHSCFLAQTQNLLGFPDIWPTKQGASESPCLYFPQI
jgi:hypothetical protein